jgi:ribonuclease J
LEEKMIRVYAVGGYNEVGKNCTAVEVDNEVVVIDLGLHLEKYIKLTEDEDIVKLSGDRLMKVGAVPDISVLGDIKKKVKALIISHGHLDHMGAVPFISNWFKAPIICPPYTAELIRGILREDRIKLNNEIIPVSVNSSYQISENLKVELIHITHSIPHSTLVAIHTKYGVVLYANDFKLDMHPTLGKKPNFKRMREISKENVLALIVESTYSDDERKMPSEQVAKEMLEDVLLGTDNKDNLIIVTTFSSHIARLKSIIEFGKKLDRRILFIGRSLSKYVSAAERIGLVNFTKDVHMAKYSGQIQRVLSKVDKDRKKYLLVTTGHQGEPKSVLHRIAKKKFNFNLYPEDNVIFSCRTIPTPTNIENRQALENELKSYGVRIFKDIHQSGHAAREDLRDFIKILKPRKLIPSHGTDGMRTSLSGLAQEMGYKLGKDVFLLMDGESQIL